MELSGSLRQLWCSALCSSRSGQWETGKTSENQITRIELLTPSWHPHGSASQQSYVSEIANTPQVAFRSLVQGSNQTRLTLDNARLRLWRFCHGTSCSVTLHAHNIIILGNGLTFAVRVEDHHCFLWAFPWVPYTEKDWWIPVVHIQ